MIKRSFKFIIFFTLCVALCGCGKTALKSGDNVSDALLAREGVCSENVLDTKLLPDSLSNALSYVSNDGYSYILECYDSVTFSSLNMFFKVDSSGNCLQSKILEIPISVFGIDVSDKNIMLDDLCSVIYLDFSFNTDGSFKSLVSFSTSDSYEIDLDQFSNDIIVEWDNDGNCISVSSVSDLDLYDHSSLYDREFIGINGKHYKLTDSGIILSDSDGNYISSYFDFINSDVSGQYFYTACVIDDDHFSGIYKNLDGKYVLSCFERSYDNDTSDKVIVIACNDLDLDLKRDILEYNISNKNSRITIIDYSDRSSSGNASEGWALLKDDIYSGFRPDMIIDSTGYDGRFISYLSDNSLVCDLNGVISECFDKKEKKFSDKAEQLFYTGNNSYALIPSYYYRTIIGRPGLFGSDEEFGSDEFLNTIYPLAASCEVFSEDSRESFIDRLLAYNGSKYVDYNNKIADFNCDEFIMYLSYAGNLPSELSDSELRFTDVPGFTWGDSFLFDTKWNNIGDAQLVSTRNCQGEYKDYGFPVSSTEGSGVISANRSYMILSTNAYTNECWDFISKYISDEYQNSLTNEIPVTDEGYNIWRDIIGFYVMDDSALYYFKDGQQYPIDIPDEENVAYIENSINSCNTIVFSDYKVESIVYDYAQQYFDGKITAEEAAASIDRDVEAYLQAS